MNDHDHGVNLDWVVKSASPWWHRGAATAAMLLMVNGVIAARRDELWIMGVSLFMAAALAMIDLVDK